MWKYLIEKEFKQFFRDPGLPRMAVMFPILMILVFPFAVSMDIRNISLVVVDHSMSMESARLIETCTASGYFRLVTGCHSAAEAQKMMDDNKADAIITIDSGFGKDTGNSSGFPVGIKINTVNGTKGSLGSQYILSCIRKYLDDSGSGQGTAAGAAVQAAGTSAIPQIEVSEKYYFNEYMDYKLFMVPALIVIAITMITAFLPALNIVSEKETGTIEQINVTPVSKTAFIVCKMIPYWVIAFFILASCLLIAWAVFGYTCKGSILALFLFTTLDIVVTAGLGLLISNYSNNAQQAMFVIWFFAMIFMLMSGIFTPVSSMATWSQYVTYMLPTTYFVEILRSVCLKGSRFADLGFQFVMLASFAVVINVIAVVTYRKQN